MGQSDSHENGSKAGLEGGRLGRRVDRLKAAGIEFESRSAGICTAAHLPHEVIILVVLRPQAIILFLLTSLYGYLYLPSARVSAMEGSLKTRFFTNTNHSLLVPFLFLFVDRVAPILSVMWGGRQLGMASVALSSRLAGSVVSRAGSQMKFRHGRQRR